MTGDLNHYQRPGLSLHYRDAAAVKPLLEGGSVEEWFSLSHQVLKEDRKTRVRLLNVNGYPVFAKLYPMHPFFKRWQACVGHHRGRHVFLSSLRLLSLGVEVPRPLAWFLSREGGRVVSGFVSEVLDAPDLKTWFSPATDDLSAEEANHVFVTVAEILAAIHNAGLAHGDMAWSNIMVDSSGKLYLTDLDGMSHPFPWQRRHLFAKDVARFTLNANEMHVPARSIEKFISRYAVLRQLEPDDVWQEIQPAYRKLAERRRKKYGIGL